MVETIAIRNYRPADRAAVIRLLQQNTPHYFAPEEEADFHLYLNDHAQHYFVMATTDGKIVGCGGYNLVDEGARISWDIFHPDFQGRGLGRQLTRYRLERLRAIPGVMRIVVRTTQLAYPFYEKQGFELMQVVKDYWAKGFDLYDMAWRGL
jgi:ribosomal protein S18 acetylase RimI-like enzyme